MTDTKPIPLPLRSEVFTSVKVSCQNCREKAAIVLNKEAINTLLTTLPSEEEQWHKLANDHGTKVPAPNIIILTREVTPEIQ